MVLHCFSSLLSLLRPEITLLQGEGKVFTYRDEDGINASAYCMFNTLAGTGSSITTPPIFSIDICALLDQQLGRFLMASG